MEARSLLARAAPAAPKAIQPEPGATDQTALWPMKVSEFLNGNWLEPADVILSRKRGDFASKIIRWAIRSHFSHAALVYVTPHCDPNYDSTFVIEAGTRGVDIANLARYVNDERSVSLVGRLKGDWFTRDIKGRVRGLVLNHIDAGYDYGAIVRILQNTWFRMQRTVRGHRSAVHSYTPKDRMAPTRFICSGLVQIGFVAAVAELVIAGKLPREAVAAVVFTGEGRAALPANLAMLPGPELKAALDRFQNDTEDLLEAVTPHDLANADALEWRHVIRDRAVYRVTSNAEAVRLLYWRPRQPALVPERGTGRRAD